MIILGCPIGLRHLHKIFNDQIRRIKYKKHEPTSSKLHFIYFSCARDIALLTLSLKSLLKLNSNRVASVSIVVDSKGPFDDSQCDILHSLHPNLRFLHLGQIDWASINTLTTELNAFHKIASQANENDFIAKVDSDILFFNPNKIEDVCNAEEDFVGDGHYSQYKYAQGGLYFIRAKLANRLFHSVTKTALEETINQCKTIAEDQVISALIDKAFIRSWLTRIMLFPDEFAHSDLNSRWLKKEFCALHFVHKKSEMQVYAIRLGII